MSGGSEVMTTTTINAATNINTDPSAFTLTPPAPSQSHSHIQNMRVSYAADGSAIFKPSTTPPHYPVQAPPEGGPPATGIQGININNMGDYHQPLPIKKKRGRPRKYGPDGSMALALGGGAPANSSVPVTHPPPHVSQQQHQHVPLTVTQPSQHPQLSAGAGAGFSPPVNAVASGIMNPGEEGVALSPSSMKKRGRPPGSGKKHRLEALGSAGFGFTPHIITVKAGEDVSSKIMAFSQHGPRAVCILSANGSISNVTLRQPATSGGTVTYEGRFEILSLSGSYLPSEDGGQRSRTGGLSVTLCSSDGRVLGGSVVGLLVAATPVQVVVGSFVADGGKDSKPVNHIEPLSATMRLASAGGSTGASSPQSRATLSESSGGPGSPLNQITSASNTSNAQGMSGISWK